MTYKILLIDDDKLQLKPLAERLEIHLKCPVLTSASIEEGVLLFDKNAASLDLVITDMDFGPDEPEGGLRILQHVWKQQLDFVPVIVLTAFENLTNSIKCMELGAFSYIPKGGLDDQTFLALIRTSKRALDFRTERLQVDVMANAVCKMVDSHEPYTGGHCERVGRYAQIVASTMGLSISEQVVARRAGLMHDLAKVGIGADMLSRPARLSDLLFEAIKAHPKVGYDMLTKVGAHPEVARAVLEHHERYDGSGYPKKSKGDEISIVGQIIGLVDCLDAMTTPRPYLGGNGRYTIAEAIEVLKEEANNGKHDKKVVECLSNSTANIWNVFEEHAKLGRLPMELYKRNLSPPEKTL